TPTCTWWNESWTYFVRDTYNFSGTNPDDNTVDEGTYTICGNERFIGIDDTVMADGNSTRYTGRYLNWLFSDDVERDHDGDGDTIYEQIIDNNNGTRSSCLTSQGRGATYSKYQRARVTAAKEILRDVICQVNAVGDVRFGLAQFQDDGDPEGGFIKVGVADYTTAHADDLNDEIDSVEGETWTPLAETLYYIYRYFMGQNSNQRPFGKDGTTRFPRYDRNLSGSGGQSSGNVPPSPIQYSCQKNFVIILTDGEPTRDDFDNLNRERFQDDLVGDYHTDNADPENNNTSGTTTGEIWGDDCSFCRETAWYLDDLAKYMQDTDVRPDITGDQVVDVYTVGFTTTDIADKILRKTAEDVGNGLFFSSNNAEELAAAIIEAVTDIVEKSQSFTAATVPASRATEGNNFYTSFFIPSDKSSYWEGHIKNFEFTGSGDILDENGDCVIGGGDPPCSTSGAISTEAVGEWDALTAMPGATARHLYMSDLSVTTQPPGSNPNRPVAFTTGNVADSDLEDTGENLGTSPFAASDFPTSTSGEDLDNLIVEYIRGCVWDSSPCTDRPGRLWDVFHSNPLIVGPPNAGINEDGYRAFAKKYGQRNRVLYAGSNGGFMHAFNAGDWVDNGTDPPGFDRGDGVEMMGFMAYPARKAVKELAKDQPGDKLYLMDGSAQSADVWFRATAASQKTASADEWHTVLLGGMRQGGRVVWALDVTDPTKSPSDTGENSSLPYPGYLWEFPCESGASGCAGSLSGGFTYADFMGETWSEPIITRIKVYANNDTDTVRERWVAIFGAGYDPEGDPNVSTSYDATSDANTSRAGRAVFMVDVQTGDVIGMKRFSHNSAVGDPRMRAAFASTPAVFDVDKDGYADVVFIGDLAGNFWKWVIHTPGQDVENGGSIDQAQWKWVKFFQGENCSNSSEGATDCPIDHYKSIYFPATGALVHGKLYLVFGTGERNALDFAGYPSDNENNRLYVMRDDDPLEVAASGGIGATAPARYDDTAVPPAGVFLDNTASTANTCPVSPHIGFYFTGVDSEKFVTPATIFLGNVFTLSFIPNPSSDPCTAGGDAFLYAFNLFCGEALFTEGETGGTGTNKVRKFTVGSGLPNRPRVSIGPVSEQGGGGDCPNKVVIITSDGTAFNDCPTELPNSGIRIRSWRDLGQR
ncbi:MAG: hypothetical protein MJE66_13705, partial [Proteobacteria bacterium]|nr:hypothetical protein [Pseudomonadota bacterium]